MTISRANASGWGTGSGLTSGQANALDLNTTYALDKRSGQTDTLASVVSCSGAGRVVETRTAGADADTTYALSSGISIIDAATGLTSGRTYTLSVTGAIAGDRVVVIGGSNDVTVKDGFDASTMGIAGTSATAHRAVLEFFFNGTRWRLYEAYAAGIGAFLVAGTSATLAAAIADETGSGALVFGTSPTIAGTPTLSGTSTSTSNDTKGTATDVNPVNVQTTDATQTVLDSFTLASNTAVTVSWLVTAIKSDYTQGAGYLVSACYCNNGGVVSQVGSTQVSSFEDNLAWDATSNRSGTTIRLLVTGAAATTVRWTSVCTRLSVIP